MTVAKVLILIHYTCTAIHKNILQYYTVKYTTPLVRLEKKDNKRERMKGLKRRTREEAED